MEQLKNMPVRQKVISIIRKAILTREFAAGQELSLTDLSQKLGVSRTPIREAFQALESEGLIELRMNKGAIVKPIDNAFIRDHFEARRLLEGEVVARVIRFQPDAAPLERLQAAMLSEQDLSAGTAYTDYNLSFHTFLWKASRSAKLHSFCEMLWNGPSYSRAVADEDHRKQSITEHGVIVSCLIRGDEESGRLAMERHIVRSMDNILRGFEMG